MADFVSHHLFGRQALTVFPAPAQRAAACRPACFFWGCQGPDPLFYRKILLGSPLHKLGNRMHSEKTDELFAALSRAVRDLSGDAQEIAAAYFYGFVCHYALDSEIHPYVYCLQVQFCTENPKLSASAVHSRIESDIDYLSTLAGYVHWKLTGKRVLGVGEASGMFPIDSKTKDYDQNMVETFDKLIAPKGYSWKLRDILPQVLVAGEPAGNLTEEGAKLLDPSGELEAGIPMCPPEGDAGTGMVATNSVTVHTGNVSAGTSVFAMVVMDENETLKKVHEEIDMVTTPDGLPVAMAHCNNCTSDLNAWVGIFKEFQQALGVPVDMNQLFSVLYNKALEGDVDCGGLMAYNYFSGESITGFEEGRPLFVRTPDSKFTLANFMRTHLYTSLGALKVGLDILFKEEGVKLDNIYGHGGLFKTKGVGQRIMAAAINAPVSLMETAGEGGAWGIALLASYMLNKKENQPLDAFLSEEVFHGETGVRMEPNAEDVAGFDAFIQRYKECLPVERAAVENLPL